MHTPATKPTAATYEDLLARHQELLAQGKSDLTLRSRRALSWLERAQAACAPSVSDASEADPDVAFICFWIAFNAAYAKDLPSAASTPEVQRLRDFLTDLCIHDRQQRRLERLLLQHSVGVVKELIENEYLFQPLWHALNQPQPDGRAHPQWRVSFIDSHHAAQKALQQRDVQALLPIVFDRLYTLRNQIIHGGSTHGSRVNRKQLHDALQLLSRLVPVMLAIMLDNPQRFNGKPFYPVVTREMIGKVL